MSPALLTEPKSCPVDVECVPPIRCPAIDRMLETEIPAVCLLADGSRGYCCTTGQNHTTPAYLRQHFSDYDRYDVVDSDVDDIMFEAEKKFSELNLGSGHRISRREATFHHGLLSGPGDVEHQNRGIQDVIASRIFSDR